MRPATCLRFKLDLAIEDPRHALDDRKAEAQSTRDPGALIKSAKFDENVTPLRFRDTNAGIVDIDTQVLATPSTADQDPSLRGVFDGVRDQVLDQTTQQPPIGADDQSTGHKREFEPFRRCERRELEPNLP